MTIDPTLLNLARELASEYDGELDTSEGSAFRTRFLDPLLRRAGGSPLDVDLENFMVSRLQAEIEDVDVSPFSAMRDLAIRAFVAMSSPLQREIEAAKITQSLNNYSSMTRAELNALLGNYFTSLREGARAVGTVRVYFPSPQSVTVTPATQFSTGSGLNFFPSVVQAISSTQMSFQQEGGAYYMDVLVQAENSGEAYNIQAREVSSVSGIGSVLRVSNRSRFSGARDEETKEEAVARTRNSITVRNLITSRGVSFVVSEAFPSVTTLQVIGYGDPEMLRDIVRGPTEVSGVPGGISGREDLDLVPGESVHIGGMTDIYTYQEVPDEEDIDIENITDKGFRVYSGKHGFTDPGAPSSSLKDEFGFFQRRGVLAGDVLLLGAGAYPISSVPSESELDVSPSVLDEGMFGLTYEIVRRQPGTLTIPLYDLVAVSPDGSAEFSLAGNPVAPVPGSPARERLVDANGLPVEKQENIATSNVELPLLRVTGVEFLDPLTKEPLGQSIPMRDLTLSRAQSDLSGGDALTRASGKVRLYFKDGVRCYTNDSTSFTAADGRTYEPLEIANGTDAEVVSAGDTITIAGQNLTTSIAVGDNFVIGSPSPASGEYTVLSVTFSGGETLVQVRESLPVASPSPYRVWPGILQANMSKDPETGLYVFDIDVECTAVGAGGNKPSGTELAGTGVFSEGWSLRSTQPDLSYSMRDLPYLQVTEWVNDTTQVSVDFTAPAVRVSYEYASSLKAVQEYVDDEPNRIVAEDVLVKHFALTYVRADLTVRSDTPASSSEDARVAAREYINSLSPTEDLEMSDVVDHLYRAGMTYVLLPSTLTGLTQTRNRSWVASFSQDTLKSSRIQHFYADF